MNQARHALIITQSPIALPSLNPQSISENTSSICWLRATKIRPSLAGSERHPHQHSPLAHNPFDTPSPPYATPTTDPESNTRDIMCMWERTVYRCGHAEPRPKRMQYSCTIWTRHVYGQCLLGDYSQINDVLDPNICPDCRRARDNQKQREKPHRTVKRDGKSGGKSSRG